MILTRAFSSQQTSEFYAQFFKPRYESFQNAVKQTPLVIMLWGPRQRTRIWSSKRMQIHDTLRRMGHTVFFSEQLGVPIAAITKKGVEFLQSETTDVIVALQSSYDVVGAVQHFSEFRVVDSKLLLFVDAAAPDARLYQRAGDDLNKCYNNIETYKYPEDVVQDNLSLRVVEKINLMQMVKHCAMQKARNWRLSIDPMTSPRAQPNAAATPFRYNLLELYREHRDEVDVLTDSAALFILAYANFVGKITAKALAHQIGLGEASLQSALAPLLRGQMLTQQGEVFVVTGFGRRVVEGAGLTGWAVPAAPPRAHPTSLPQLAIGWRTAGMALAAVLLFFVMFAYWTNTVQTQLPLEYTPTRPAITSIVTRTPTPLVTPPATR